MNTTNKEVFSTIEDEELRGKVERAEYITDDEMEKLTKGQLKRFKALRYEKRMAKKAEKEAGTPLEGLSSSEKVKATGYKMKDFYKLPSEKRAEILGAVTHADVAKMQERERQISREIDRDEKRRIAIINR